MNTEEQIRAEIESIDWESIRDENRLRAIGSELYEYAHRMEQDGYENTVAVVATIMDGFWSNVPHRMRERDGHHIANGFARALMLDKCRTIDNEETE